MRFESLIRAAMIVFILFMDRISRYSQLGRFYHFIDLRITCLFSRDNAALLDSFGTLGCKSETMVVSQTRGWSSYSKSWTSSVQ